MALPSSLQHLGQLVLDFFAPDDAIEKIAAQAYFSPDIGKNAQKSAEDSSNLAPHTLNTSSALNTSVQAPAAALTGFIHPQATHRMLLGQEAIAYQLVRCKRRSVGFVIRAQGLQIRAPRWVSVGEIESLIDERAEWILKHWRRQLQQQATHSPEHWGDGSTHGLHGRTLRLQLDTSLPRGQHRHQHPHQGQGQDQGDVLHLALPAHASAQQIQKAALRWYADYAFAHLQERLQHYAPLLGVQWRTLGLSNAKTRWGSAAADGSIRLHWRLVQLAPELMDYVVIHELAHLHEMNHSPRFWAIVARHCPNYQTLRRQLRQHPLAST